MNMMVMAIYIIMFMFLYVLVWMPEMYAYQNDLE
jgi:hypothetical protein